MDFVDDHYTVLIGITSIGWNILPDICRGQTVITNKGEALVDDVFNLFRNGILCGLGKLIKVLLLIGHGGEEGSISVQESIGESKLLCGLACLCSQGLLSPVLVVHVERVTTLSQLAAVVRFQGRR